MTEPVRHLEYRQRFDRAAGLLLAVGASLAAVGIAAVAERWLGLADLSLVFMLAVLLVASRTRTGPALATAVLCFLAYNFFFLPPVHTFTVNDPSHVVALIFFLAAALMASFNVLGSVIGTHLALRHGSALVRKVFLLVVCSLILKFAWDTF